METILQKYEFRTIRLEETEQAAEIERICFPPNEACSYEHMAARIKKAPDLFLVAVDRETGKYRFSQWFGNSSGTSHR